MHLLCVQNMFTIEFEKKIRDEFRIYLVFL